MNWANLVNNQSFSGEELMVGSNSRWKIGQEIMGQNFFGIANNIVHFGIKPDRGKVNCLSEMKTPDGWPITKEDLGERKDTHILFADFGTSIIETALAIQRIHPGRILINPNEFLLDDGVRNSVISRRGMVGWHLIRKDVIHDSNNLAWKGQLGLVPDGEEVPKARVLFAAILGHLLSTGERLFERCLLRCGNFDYQGRRVTIGLNDEEGVVLGSRWDKAYSDVFITTSPKLQMG